MLLVQTDQHYWEVKQMIEILNDLLTHLKGKDVNYWKNHMMETIQIYFV